MTSIINNVQIDVGGDKTSDKARIGRIGVVSAMAMTTALYQTDPTFKDLIDKFIQSGADLKDADDEVAKCEAALDKARSGRLIKRNTYDKIHTACAASVKVHSATAEDAQGYGFAVLQKAASALVPPSGIDVKYDLVKAAILIHVLYASGKHRCIIEVSPDPVGSGTWKRPEGNGVEQALYGYAPGMWWVRAATVRAKKQSDWFGPVAVLVK